MSKNKQKYDEGSRTLRVYRGFADTRTLVPSEEVQGVMAMLREKKTSDGQEVSRVQYVFEDAGTAEYNHQALAFAGIETYVGDEKSSKPYESDDGTPGFSVREDFGID